MTLDAVSIIVPTFNRARYLGECLDSLLAQTVPAQQILVIDDGSEDDTPSLLASYGQRISTIRKPNGGKPAAVNLALGHCTGSLIWLFDDDDVALPDAIESRLRVLATAPAAGFVYSAHRLGSDGPDGRIVAGRLCQPMQPTTEAFFFELMRNCFFHLNSALVRRELYAAAGAFDGELKAGEDYDMQIRLARLGRAVCSPAPSFLFRQHTGVRGDKAQQYKAEQRSRVFRRYSAMLGRKLRQALPLGDYLMPRTAQVLDAAQQSQALLNRAQVMANHGCIAELFEDVQEWAAQKSAPPSCTEAEALSLAMRTGWAYDAAGDDWPGFFAQVRALRHARDGSFASSALALGVWQMARGYPGTWSERTARALRAAQIAWSGRHIL